MKLKKIYLENGKVGFRFRPESTSTRVCNNKSEAGTVFTKYRHYHAKLYDYPKSIERLKKESERRNKRILNRPKTHLVEREDFRQERFTSRTVEIDGKTYTFSGVQLTPNERRKFRELKRKKENEAEKNK